MVVTVMLMGTAACSSPHASGGSGLPIRYVVIPHPDDEFSVWSMVDDRHYNVFVLLTQGEGSGYCDGHGLDAGAGERPPLPQPFAGPRTATCAAQRLDSWRQFLDDMGTADPAVGPAKLIGVLRARSMPGQPTPTRCGPTGCGPADTVQLWIGSRSARIVFDLGDGQVTPRSATWAIQEARLLRFRLPTQHETDIVGATYLNTADPHWFRYDHTDQRALAAALSSIDQHVPQGEWGRTFPTDPRRSATFRVAPPVWCAAVCVSPGPVDPVANPDARRTGALQRDYGWLAFPYGYWAATTQPVASFYSQEQDFWHR